MRLAAFFDELEKISRRRQSPISRKVQGKKVKTGDIMSSSASVERDGNMEEKAPDPEKGYGHYNTPQYTVPQGRHIGFK